VNGIERKDNPMATNDRPNLPSLRTTIDMARNASGGFDAEAFWVMDKRDNQLVEDEILQGAGSKSFVYSFKISGKQVSGISVIGARHLAATYGGMRHRIIASIQKDGALHTITSYPTEERPMAQSAAILPELADEPDYYQCLVELTDLKTGNTLQVEARERRFESRDDGSHWEKPHFQKIAQSKAYRNAVINIIPQDVVLRWKLQQLALTETITDDVIGQKRKAILAYTAKAAIPLARDAVAQLTMEQISALSDVAREGDKARFMDALDGLGLRRDEGNHDQDGEDKGQASERAQKARAPAKGQQSGKAEAGQEPAQAGTRPDLGARMPGVTPSDLPIEEREGDEKPSAAGRQRRSSLFPRDEQ
jgi:hypothetical protein